ncbi:hypothetical protein [Oryza sativa Japonica Group]|uniref:Uncharacterized protein P0031D11.14 n=1 Tax=Oryza sativa subsp. japonica TaxID=39947 RepID=Q5NA13_ORYSJ|nr:hypothetical protein [Oryza sativa Japonica Group]
MEKEDLPKLFSCPTWPSTCLVDTFAASAVEASSSTPPAKLRSSENTAWVACRAARVHEVSFTKWKLRWWSAFSQTEMRFMNNNLDDEYTLDVLEYLDEAWAGKLVLVVITRSRSCVMDLLSRCSLAGLALCLSD